MGKTMRSMFDYELNCSGAASTSIITPDQVGRPLALAGELYHQLFLQNSRV